MINRSVFCVLLSGVSAFGIPTMARAQLDGLPQSDQTAYPRGQEIIVTARRREENLQDVPVSITALGPAALERSTIQSVQDIGTIAPGLRYGAEGGKTSATVSLRGLSQTPLGAGTPGVVQYFADIPLPSEGSNIPTYDLGSIQVLKGPQGTLFGRNTLGGAILITPQAPEREFGGYVEATYGRFDYKELEAAINIPLGDIGAFRAAGQIRRQDGRTKNFEGGPDFDNIHQDSFRLSLLLEPFEGFSNTTIFDWYEGDERAGGLYLYRNNPGVVPGLSTILDPQIQSALSTQRQNFYGAFQGETNGGIAYSKSWGITNRTTLELGKFTLRNIFGYRKSRQEQLINSGAVPSLLLPNGAPFTLFSAASLNDRKYLTNETQVLAEFGRVEAIVGAFYGNDKPNGPSGSGFKAFSAVAAPRPAVSIHYVNRNYAVFGQVNVPITERLSLDLGGRYSWDEVTSCGGAIPGGYADYATCQEVANRGLPTDGVGIVGTKSEEPSWTIALNYQLTDDVLLYGTTRRGYRAASVNTPLFESAFTTGGVAPGCGFTTPPATGQCPDLRPFQSTGKEILTDYEIGFKSKFRLGTATGRFNIAAFYNDYKDALQFLNVLGTGVPQQGVPDAPNRTAIAANAADIAIYGIELDASVSPSPELTVFFNAAFTKSEIKKIVLPPLQGFAFSEGSITLPTPDFSGTIGVNWILPFRPADSDLVFNSDLYMTDDFGGQNGERLPGYVLANARLDWKDIGRSGLDLGFYVKNLFGERYFSSPSILGLPLPIASLYTGDPRTWGVSARFAF